MANTAHQYSRGLQATSLADQLSLLANEHTVLPADDEHRELQQQNSPKNTKRFEQSLSLVSIQHNACNTKTD